MGPFAFHWVVSFVGAVAQLGERLLCKQEVIGSIPFSSTKFTVTQVGECRGASGGEWGLVAQLVRARA